MKILHINVRLTEGGAAGVALNLSVRQNSKNGVESAFAYGYSKRGGRNPAEDKYHARKMISMPLATLNYASYAFLNRDIFPAFNYRKWKEEFSKVDVVHLHVLHSYFVDYRKLFALIFELGKPVVWTQHDLWALTGRCAFTDGCERWKKSCYECPTTKNYPPVKYDWASSNYAEKHQVLRRFVDYGGILVAPSNHLARDFSLSGYDISVINNGLDLKSEEFIRNCVLEPESKNVQVLVMAHDLSYEGKTKASLINRLISNFPSYTFNMIGKNSPFSGHNVINHGYIEHGKDFFDLISKMDAMVFTSSVDNYPLVLGECLSLGVAVLATDSSASREVLGKIGARPANDFNEIIESLESRTWLADYNFGLSRRELAEKAIRSFSGETMALEYMEIYDRAIANAS